MVAIMRIDTSHRPLTLARITRVWWPLAASWLLMGAELPALNAVVARLPNPVVNLAAFFCAARYAAASSSTPSSASATTSGSTPFRLSSLLSAARLRGLEDSRLSLQKRAKAKSSSNPFAFNVRSVLSIVRRPKPFLSNQTPISNSLRGR